jgi:hypothetical protein
MARPKPGQGPQSLLEIVQRIEAQAAAAQAEQADTVGVWDILSPDLAEATAAMQRWLAGAKLV